MLQVKRELFGKIHHGGHGEGFMDWGNYYSLFSDINTSGVTAGIVDLEKSCMLRVII